MSISSNTTGDGKEATIKISGRFDFSQNQAFRSALEDTGASVQKFVVDLGGTDYVDSSALGMLLVLRDKVGGQKDHVKIVNVNPEVKKILTIANFGQLFAIV